jgi:hypothetical protein
VARVLAGILTGAAVGAVLLGVGGRLAMFVFAVSTGRSPVFTVGGSLKVVVAGAMSGAAGGLLLGLGHRLLPTRRMLRGACFAALCYLIAIPGFRPPTPLVFALFAPLFLAFGVTCVWFHDRLLVSAPV